ncbi:MAG: hypothetical protein Q9214_000721 [Letrouitia sp. 1 TL-2023]
MDQGGGALIAHTNLRGSTSIERRQTLYLTISQFGHAGFAMNTQGDSLDISQLKAAALSLQLATGDLHASPNAVGQPRQRFEHVGIATRNLPSNGSSSLTTKPLVQQDAIHIAIQPRPFLNPNPPQSAFRSTIPDSTNAQMTGTQDILSQGDTQPITQSDWDEFDRNRIKQLQAPQSLSEQGGTIVGNETVTPHTFLPGQTGHVDIISALGEPSLSEPIDSRGEDSDDEVGDISQGQYVRTELYPESKRFRQPKTPMTAGGQKRKRDSGITLQSEATPGYPINPFTGQANGMEGLMNTSQVFKATQAPSSPITNVLPSDGLSQRPSPNFSEIQRPSTADVLSTPLRPQSAMVRAVTEPQTVYVSMKESQAERDRQLLDAAEGKSRLEPDVSDDDFAFDDSVLRRLKNQQRMELEAKENFAGISARIVSTSTSRGRGRGRPPRSRIKVNAPAVENARNVIILSDDLPRKNTIDGTEDETEHESDHDTVSDDEIDELNDENKENRNGHSIQVPMTASGIKHGHVADSDSSPLLHREAGTAHTARSMMQAVSGAQLHSMAAQEKTADPITGSPTFAVADSQPTASHTTSKTQGQSTNNLGIAPPSSPDSRFFVPPTQLSPLQNASASPSDTPHDLRSRPLASVDKIHKNPRDSSRAADNISNTFLILNHSTASPGGELDGAVPNVVVPVPAVATDELREDAHLSQRNNITLAPSTIPESSSGPPTLNADSSVNVVPAPGDAPNAAINTRTTSLFSSNQVSESNASPRFETAQSQLPAILDKPKDQHEQQQVQQNGLSPHCLSSRIRTMAEIIAQPPPSDAIGSVDVDINLMTSDDVDYHRIMSDNGSSPILPSRKRRKGLVGQAVRITDQRQISSPSSELSLHSSIVTSEALNKHSSPVTAVDGVAQQSSPLLWPRDVAEVVSDAAQPADQLEDIPSRKPRRARGRPRKHPLQVAPRVPMDDTHKPTELPIHKQSLNGTTRLAHSSPKSAGLTLEMPSGILAPNRVLAYFKGRFSGYYPATCLKASDGSDPKYTVRFDDGNVDLISSNSIKRFELREGDMIKVDEEGLRSNSFVIEGFQKEQQPGIAANKSCRKGQAQIIASPNIPLTDIFGQTAVRITQKLRLSTQGIPCNPQPITVPIERIYLTPTMWTSFRDRAYTHSSTQHDHVGDLLTSMERPSAPSTPTSRSRRSRLPAANTSRSTLSTTNHSAGIFSNMVFALSKISTEEKHTYISELVQNNGGLILYSGFDELFHLPSLYPATPGELDAQRETNNSPLHLTQSAATTGFTSVLADKHSRSIKYIQALALGIPCLSSNWVQDCVSKARIIPWEPYLLASGESAFLDGAVRSRIMEYRYPAETAKLALMFQNRPKLMDGGSVLLIMSKDKERAMENHPLLTYALGAKKVVRVVNEEEARNKIVETRANGEDWDWVYSHEGEDEVKRALFGGSWGKGKRKRGTNVWRPEVERGKIKVVGNEFVIQSLILGRLAHVD